MLDELNNLSSGDGRKPGAPEAGGRAASEREVPIVATSSFEAMHRWLDGEASEAEAMRNPESARYVALWRRVGRETGRRRADGPSADFAGRVMAALPGASMPVADLAFAAPSSSAATAAPSTAASAVAARAARPESATWWQRPVEVTPTTAIAAAAGLVAVGALLASMRGQ